MITVRTPHSGGEVTSCSPRHWTTPPPPGRGLWHGGGSRGRAAGPAAPVAPTKPVTTQPVRAAASAPSVTAASACPAATATSARGTRRGSPNSEWRTLKSARGHRTRPRPILPGMPDVEQRGFSARERTRPGKCKVSLQQYWLSGCAGQMKEMKVTQHTQAPDKSVSL